MSEKLDQIKKAYETAKEHDITGYHGFLYDLIKELIDLVAEQEKKINQCLGFMHRDDKLR